MDVLAVGDLSETKGDARANLDRLPGEPPRPFAPEELEGSGAIVDAMLGTGFEGEPRDPVASAIAAINEADAPIVACDVPSGVNASTGEVEADAVRADVTATFHGPKVGLFVDPGKEHAGRVEVVEIGIPRDAPRPDASRPDLAGRARARAAAPAIGHEVQVGRGRRRGRRARPDRRADDGGARRQCAPARATCRWPCRPPPSPAST